MIDELKPLLDKYKLDLRIEKKDNHLHLYVIPTLLDKDMSDEDKNVLERPLFKKYDLSERVDDGLANELLSYSNALIEGEDVISQIEKDIKAHAEKKKSSTKPAKAATKPKRKTKAEEQAEAREKQAKEREGQSDLNLGGENRLAAKEPEKVMPLKEKQIEEIESQSDAPLKEKQIEEMEGGLNLDLPSLEDL